jgi:glycerophosphoryl diester phosphodiesterase
MTALPPGVAVNIDLKTVIEDAADDPCRRTATLVAGALREYAGQRRLFVSSFDPGLLLYLKSQRDIAAKPSLGLITWLFECVHSRGRLSWGSVGGWAWRSSWRCA